MSAGLAPSPVVRHDYFIHVYFVLNGNFSFRNVAANVCFLKGVMKLNYLIASC